MLFVKIAKVAKIVSCVKISGFYADIVAILAILIVARNMPLWQRNRKKARNVLRHWYIILTIVAIGTYLKN